MTPDLPPRKTAPMTFDALLDQAMTAYGHYKKTFAHALDLGIRPKDILSYAQGTMPPGERDRFHGVLHQSPWALDRVVALVKAKREDRLACITLPDDDSAGCELLDRLRR